MSSLALFLELLLSISKQHTLPDTFIELLLSYGGSATGIPVYQVEIAGLSMTYTGQLGQFRRTLNSQQQSYTKFSACALAQFQVQTETIHSQVSAILPTEGAKLSTDGRGFSSPPTGEGNFCGSPKGRGPEMAESMASPMVPRRSARLSARTTTASVVHSASPSPEREVVARKRRRNCENCGKKVTSMLTKKEVISPERGKISAYFSKIISDSKIVSGGKKKKTAKYSNVAMKTTCEAGNKYSGKASEVLAIQEFSSIPPINSGEEAQIPVKNERKLKKGPSRDMEAELWEMGFEHIAGVDEAGRGPLAGPVVAAACIIPSHVVIQGINDSKQLTEERREELYSQLTTTPGISYAVHVIDAQTIDKVNILQATMQAMAACVEKLNAVESGLPGPDFILVDGNRLPSDIPETLARSVVKGDAICHVIAAASILAKVTRDRLMISYDEKWPIYGFKAHKGYGTAAHIAAIRKHGPCDIHRLSFAPLKEKTISTSGA